MNSGSSDHEGPSYIGPRPGNVNEAINGQNIMVGSLALEEQY